MGLSLSQPPPSSLLICFSQLSFQNILSASRRERRGSLNGHLCLRFPTWGSLFSVTKWARPLPGIRCQIHTEDSSSGVLGSPTLLSRVDHLVGEKGPRPQQAGRTTRVMATAGLLRHLTIPWNLLCQVMAELGCLGESLKALVSRAARAKEGIWVQLALHMTRKKKKVWCLGLGR